MLVVQEANTYRVAHNATDFVRASGAGNNTRADRSRCRSTRQGVMRGKMGFNVIGEKFGRLLSYGRVMVLTVSDAVSEKRGFLWIWILLIQVTSWSEDAVNLRAKS